MTTLVTGATGFIGRRVVEALRAAGEPVRAFVRGEAPRDWTDVARGDVGDADSVRAAMDGVAHVIHLAGIADGSGTTAQHRDVTVGGTDNVLDALPPGAHLVFASSLVVYGARLREATCAEDDPMGTPMGPYSVAKQEAERRIALRAPDAARVRLVNVYGPGSGPWVREPIGQMRSGLPALVGGGGGGAALVHVDDAARLLVAARHGSGVFNATGLSVTWREYFSDLAGLAGCRPPRSVPLPAALFAAWACDLVWSALGRSDRPPLSREAVNLVGSDLRVAGRRSHELLGWAPRVAYEEGLETLRVALEAGSDGN